VQGPDDKFLAGPRLASDEDAFGLGTEEGDLTEHVAHRAIGGVDDRGGAGVVDGAGAGGFAADLGAPAIDDGDELVNVEWRVGNLGGAGPGFAAAVARVDQEPTGFLFDHKAGEHWRA
jgi:hypothetical protein